MLVTDRVADAPSLVRCTDAAKLRFETRTAQPVQKELIPYFEVGGRRMMSIPPPAHGDMAGPVGGPADAGGP